MARHDRHALNTRERDSVSWFLDQAGRIPLLTDEEEVLLGRAVQDWVALRQVESPTPAQRRTIRAGRRAYDRMFNANLRLVVNVSKRYLVAVRSLELSDLIQEGSFGLARAIEKFDPARGYKFSTYAYWWIRQGVSRAISQQDRSIRLPVNAVDCLSKLRRWVPEFVRTHGRSPTNEECAEHCGVTRFVMRHYLNHIDSPTSLDAKCTKEESSTARLDMVAGAEPAPMELLEIADGLDRLDSWIANLTEQQADVLTARYGLDGKMPLTQMEAGRQLGCTRQAIQQAEARSMNRLRVMAQGAMA